MKNIDYKSLKPQNYFTSNSFSLSDKQMLFSLRTRMLNVKQNIKNMYPGNLGCNLCNECDIQTQDHLLNCQKIISNCEELFNNIHFEHDDIYGSTKKQLSVAKLYSKVITLENLESSEDTIPDQD